ncbi:exocyst complex component exo84 [Agyrium rufum]|nr:exocyst complex component exo84 [Agyrium rufum]
MADVEKSKGISLRKKKDKSSRRQAVNITGPLDVPRPATSSSIGSQSTAARSVRPEVRDRLKPPGGTTSDIIKKRYSVRYNQVPDFGGPEQPLPALPAQFAQQKGRDTASPVPQQRGVDVKALRDPGLSAEEYITDVLAGATEADIQEYQASLRKVQNRASSDLQQNVYQNRTQFIKISKEAEKLKDEMRSLRGLMSDLSSTLSQASLSAPTANGQRSPSFDENSVSARKRANRSSVANLEALWNTQLQALWKNIEGSQKFLPAIPGRHVVMESGQWIELDSATYKSRRPVHLVLLNDHLLVATKKTKRVDPGSMLSPNAAQQKAPTKLVAIRCWPLTEIDLTEPDASRVPNGKDIANALTIRHGQESFTVRSNRSSSSEKTSIILAFKRTVDELRRAEKAEVGEQQLGNGLSNPGATAKSVNANGRQENINSLVSRDPAIANSPGILRSLSKTKDRGAEILIDVDGRQHNLRWVEGQIDELDIEIALQGFEEAVTHVEQLRKLAKGLKGNTLAQEVIMAKVDERAKKLADQVLHLLRHSHTSLTPTLLYTTYLTRLSLAPLARQTYLASRTSYLLSLTRSIAFTGSLPQYISQLSYITFTVIKNTVTTFNRCFPDTKTSGSVVVWAKERVDGFIKVVRGQMDGLMDDQGEEGKRVREECLEIAREFAGDVGAEVGFEFGILVRKGLEGVGEEGGYGSGIANGNGNGEHVGI